MPTTLVLGGARSGKTGYALRRAEASGAPLLMIATAEALDGEMAERIARHRRERDARWRTVEAPLDLAGALGEASPQEVVVVDCLTLWLSNILLSGDEDLERRTQGLLRAMREPGVRLLVSNEVGWGVVPDNALARRFRDEAGRLHQRLASEAEEVVLVTAGLPMTLKA